MRRPFVLILSTSGGAGHIRAAEALLEAAEQSGLPIRAQHFDCLDFTTKTFKRLYSQSYLSMVNRAPELWGYFYDQAERKPYSKKGLIRLFDQFNYDRYFRELKRLRPDVIVCTHFLPYVSISDRARREGVNAPFVAATTDFDVHQLWVDQLVSRYYVFHEESAWQLSAKGIPPESISILGIPIAGPFAHLSDTSSTRRDLGIAPDAFTILLLSGGFGVGRIEAMTESIATLLTSYPHRTFNLLIVTGKNERIKANLEKKRYPGNIHARVFGFVKNIHELMSASDILVSKSGGLTSAEAMAKQLPMIIVDPIPGQESRNAAIIVEHGAGMLALDHHNLQFKLKRILDEPHALQALAQGTKRLAKPQAARDIITDVFHRFTLMQLNE